MHGATFPVWIANFVLMEYGTGAIFGCPAHDQRDLDFARKYGLPVVPVVLPPGEDPAASQSATRPMSVPAGIFNSGFLDGLDVRRRRSGGDRANWSGWASARAWSTGGCATGACRRQRYWGCPIPVIHCDACGVVPVPDDQIAGACCRTM